VDNAQGRSRGNGHRTKEANILILWGDDIGWFNISAYNLGIMGTGPRTSTASPGRGDVHRLVRPAELHRGAGLLHHRAVARSGRVSAKVGLPGASSAFSRRIRPIAELLKPHGYMCGQFGKKPPRATATSSCRPCTGSTSLRQPLPPERRGGAGERGLPEVSRVQEEVRATRACCAPGRSPMEPRRSRTPARSRRSAWRPSTTDHASAPRLHNERPAQGGKPFFCWW